MSPDPAYLARFKADVATKTPMELFELYVAPNRCMGLTDVDEGVLRTVIAKELKIEQSQVMIVGSAKIGFTLRFKEGKQPEPDSDDEPEADRPAFSPFYEGSDVDVAIVSDRLFDIIWKGCFEYWHTSGYGEGGAWHRGKNFRNYIFRGWMRPDYLPSSGSFTYQREWFDLFRKLTNSRLAGDYPIKAGLYREAYFLERYQHIALAKCRAELRRAP